MSPQARILCVDDEVNVLHSLRRVLRGRYAVEGEEDPRQAVRRLEAGERFQVVISDMRMPRMDGAAFLKQARRLQPDATRILLTGYADLHSAVAAVNQGGIFRFLTKPTPTEQLHAAVADAVRQNELLTSEKVLLQQTLKGSIRMLVDVLEMTSPAAFGRAQRLRKGVQEVCSRLSVERGWQVEVAALLSQVGSIALPPDLLERLGAGAALSPPERTQVEECPAVALRLLAAIPRLEGVKDILRSLAPEVSGEEIGPEARMGAEVLRAVADMDLLLGEGRSTEEALQILRGRTGRHDPAILRALAAIHREREREAAIQARELEGLEVGMVLAADLHDAQGRLLLARGHELSPGSLERLAALRRRGLVEGPCYVRSGEALEPVTGEVAS